LLDFGLSLDENGENLRNMKKIGLSVPRVFKNPIARSSTACFQASDKRHQRRQDDEPQYRRGKMSSANQKA
jgi:hypothetical protein